MALDLDFSQYLNDLTPQGASTSLESFQGIPGIGSAPMAQMPAPPPPAATNTASPQPSARNEGLSIAQIIGLALEGAAAGYQGRAPQGPALLMRSREFQQQKKIEDEKLQIAKEQIRSQKINHFFDFLGKFDVDEDTASKAVDAFIASNSDLKEVFGHLSGNIRIAGKDKQEVKTTTQLEAGMMKDPVTGNPLPAGTYEITARHKGGKLNVTGIKPVESSSFSRVDVEKFTAESIEEFEKTGKRSSLVPRDKADKPQSINENDVIGFVESDGKVKGPSIPEGFDVKMAAKFLVNKRAIAQQNTNIRFEGMEQMKERTARLNTEQMRLLNNFDEAEQVLTDLKTTHAKAFPKGKPVSAALKGLLLQSNAARTLREAIIPEDAPGLTDAERDFVAARNTVNASLYKLTDERQLSEQEGLRNLQSFNPGVSAEQFQKNVESRLGSIKRQRSNWEARLTGSGRTIPAGASGTATPSSDGKQPPKIIGPIQIVK